MIFTEDWQYWKSSVGEMVTLVCPDCGKGYDLDHDVSASGVVTPSVDCPTDACSFHDSVTLVGWRGVGVVRSGSGADSP